MTTDGLYKNLSAYDGAGDESAPVPATGLVTLDIDDHYFPVPCDDADLVAIHILTDATIAGTFTVEGCNFPRRRDETGPLSVADHNETSGNWVQINIAAAGYGQGVGTGWTVTVLSLAKTAGAGGAIINLSNVAFRRLRVKAAITTGGACRVVAHGKKRG